MRKLGEGREIMTSISSSGVDLFLSDDDEVDGLAPSSDSSSIGAPDDDDVSDEEGDGAVLSRSAGVLNSLNSLEDALPIKRGLSNFFSGKSKSFANLSEVTTVIESVKEIEKSENPFNKKRRILMANRWSKKSSFYAWQNPISMPLLALEEDANEEEEEGDEELSLRSANQANHRALASSFSSSSSSSLESKAQQEGDEGSRWPAMMQLTTQSCCALSDLR